MSSQFLRLKEGPYLLTLLVATFAWLIARTADRLRSGPIVEYRLEERNKPDGAWVACHVENLCVDRVFRDVKFTLAGPKKVGEFFTNCEVIHFPPGETPNEPVPPTPNESASQLSIVFKEFHPKWQFGFKAKKIGSFECQLKMATAGNEKEGKLPDAVLALELTEAGLSTCLIRHEFEILSSLLGVSLILIFSYLWWLNKATAGGNPGHKNNPAIESKTKNNDV